MMLKPEAILRTELATLRAYVVPQTTTPIKLDAMENPYSFPASLREDWMRELNRVELNRYPDAHVVELRKTFQQVFSLPPKLELMFGNGSDELIQLLIMAIAKPDATVLTVTPSFSMYKLIAKYMGVNVVEVPLRRDCFSLQLDRLLEQIHTHQPAIIFLACPNNPTGTLWPQEEIEEVIKQATGLVVLDEAYSPFASYSMISLVARYPHAILMRTVSKMGLAGLRLGWMLGDPQWMVELDKIRLPYNVNALTQASVNFAMQNISAFDEQAKLIRQQRERLANALRSTGQLRVYPSEANFILFKVLKGSAEEVYQALLNEGILIKNISDEDLLENCLRVTVGTELENQAVINALNACL